MKVMQQFIWVCITLLSACALPLGAAAAPSPKKGAEKAAAVGQSQAEAFTTGLLSGAAAGATVDLILFPLDTIKTRLQAKAGAKLTVGMFKGLLDGVGPAMAASAPCAAAFFASYDSLKHTLNERVKEGSRLKPFVPAVAAAGADLAQSIIRVPFEVVKQRLQAGVDATAMGAVSSILKTQGAKGLYNGWGALALRDLPFDIIQFPMYEYFKREWARRKGSALEPWEGSLCGYVAGGISAGLTTPLDVVKTRLMTGAGGIGIGECLQRIVQDEGFSALYSGAVPRMTSIALGGAIFFGTYEFAKKQIILLKEK
jgi:solute carrier family 25 S-adenosylmethionine transporter 26